MKSLNKSTRILGLVIAAACLGACGDDGDGTPAIDAAAGVTFNVTLTKAQEVMTCVGAGDTATGTATVTVSPDNAMLAVTNVTYSGLSGPATAAHVHANAAGMNGGVVLTFSTVTSPFSQTFVAADYTAAAGAPATFAGFVTSLLAGGAYINIHTAACPGGEIRGQID